MGIDFNQTVTVNDTVMVKSSPDSSTAGLVGKLGTVVSFDTYKKGWVAVEFFEKNHYTYDCRGEVPSGKGYFVPLASLVRMFRLDLLKDSFSV